MTIWEKLRNAENCGEAGAVLDRALPGTCPPPWSRQCISPEAGGCASCWGLWLDSPGDMSGRKEVT